MIKIPEPASSTAPPKIADFCNKIGTDQGITGTNITLQNFSQVTLGACNFANTCTASNPLAVGSIASNVSTGDATTTFTNDNQIILNTLNMNGAPAVTIQNGSIVTGVGSIGNTVVQSGGNALAPLAITVNGNLTFQNGSIFDPLSGIGNSLQGTPFNSPLTVNGNVTIQPGAAITEYQNGAFISAPYVSSISSYGG